MPASKAALRLGNSIDDDGRSIRSDDDSDASERRSRMGEESVELDGANGKSDKDKLVPTIAGSETKSVGQMKRIVFLVLIGSAIGVAFTTYFYLSGLEQDNFDRQFEDDSNKILEAIGKSLDKTLGLLDSIAVAYVSQAKANNDSFPFVTLPDFALRMSKIMPLSDAIIINMSPVVTNETRAEWEAYSVTHDDWVDETLAIQESWGKYYGPLDYNGRSFPTIHGDDDVDIEWNVTRKFLPMWQTFPVIANDTYTYNWDWLSTSTIWHKNICLNTHKAVVSDPFLIPGDPIAEEEAASWVGYYDNFIDKSEDPFAPISNFWYPIVNETDRVYVAGAEGYDYNTTSSQVVGVLVAEFYWRSMFRDILPEDSNGIHIHVSNPIGQPFTYRIDGHKAIYVGGGSEHEKKFAKYDKIGLRRTLGELRKDANYDSTYSGAKLDETRCPITLHLYPSTVMRNRYMTWSPLIFTFGVLLIFAFCLFVFYIFERNVERRQEKVMKTAVRSSAIVSDLFPASVRDRLYPAESTAQTKSNNKHKNTRFEGIPEENQDVTGDSTPLTGSPIAELYPETTVLFADLAGFTSWSSTRQPSQVFTLLETLYGAFDAIAKQRGVFKVETIGDCYVAVVGLPTPRAHHAVVMARFAADCRAKMSVLITELETTLGPGTADLAMRIGLNSGPTTGGVLRGEKSRFQLFGDTVNTAARMESNGERNRIHVSESTAERIRLAGKGHWLTARRDKIIAKGKGEMQTYWCEPSAVASSNAESINSATGAEAKLAASLSSLPSERNMASERKLDHVDKMHVDWHVELFGGLLKKVVQWHQASNVTQESDLGTTTSVTGKPIDEIADIIAFPKFVAGSSMDSKVEVNAAVQSQLRTLISAIAAQYGEHAFHNFHHCSHVAMSTVKLLGRIEDAGKESADAIVFDPLTKFAIVFAALIHDIDHSGVSNAQLVKENSPAAVVYAGKSVAEQHSLDVTWNLFMDSSFVDLRLALFTSGAEMKHFRQILVNAVMATDLFGVDAKAVRDKRWDRLVTEGNGSKDLRATIAMDLIIQASDVSHTMQHFTVYKKWNMNLMAEMHAAYKVGRAAKDPTEGWYEGELWFFDNYVTPLAQKLRERSVFGVSCDEYLEYTRDNRAEWQAKGRDIVEEANRFWQEADRMKERVDI